MNNEYVRQRLAPCGLNCIKCFAFKTDDIAHLSQKLKEALGNFNNYAKRFIDILDEKVFLKYPDLRRCYNTFQCLIVVDAE